jgi:hypothetical protein
MKCDEEIGSSRRPLDSPSSGDSERKLLCVSKASLPGAKHKSGSPAEILARRDGSEPATLAPLNFKVTKAFRREFKTYASQHDMKMVELLREGFRLIREHHDG